MKLTNRKIHEEIHLNLTPMMDLFVGLIPFLILSATFVQLGGVDVNGPSAAEKKIEKKVENELWLAVEVNDQKISITGYNQDFDKTIDSVKAEFTFDQLPSLQKYLDDLQAKNFKMGPSLFHAAPEAAYEKVMACLTTMRSSKTVNEIVMASSVVE